MMEVSHSIEEPDGNSVVKRLSVPIGLEELMTSLTKEVLKKKPIDIYNFASDHFTQLLSLREDGNYPEPTAKIITYINNVDFKTGKKNEKQSKDKQLARQVSLNVQPFIQDFKIVGKKSELKSDKRNKKEEVAKQRNEKLKLNKKKSLSKLDQEKNLNSQNDKNKSKEGNGEVNKKSQKMLDKPLPSKGKSTKIKKRVKSVDNFTSFSNFSKNHNIIDPEDIQISSLEKDNVSLSSENINAKNYDPLALRKELIKVQDESKFTSFTTIYNPYKLRQEIRSTSLDETTTKNGELERKFLKDDAGASNNETVNIEVENVEEKDCSINESDKAKDVILDKNSNFHESSVIEKEEINNLKESEAISTADAANEHNHDKDIINENVKEMLSEENNLNEPPKTSNEENVYNVSKIFASSGLAAVKIQSMWRGFKTRKSVPVINKNSNLENKEETSTTFSGLNNVMMLNAATKIQAGIRGFLSRKQNKKVVNVINDEKQNSELKNEDELKEKTQNVISNNESEFNDNLIECNENTQEVNLVTANLNSNENDDKCLNQDESIHSEIIDAVAINRDLTEIEIVNKETTKGLDESTESSSLQNVTESNIQTVIENKESNSISNEINTTPSIDIKNIESEVKEETSKIGENLPKFEETTINENIIDEIVSTELNKNSQIIETIEKHVVIEENVNSKELELKSIASELDETNLPSTTTELNLKLENNDNINEKEDEEKLESLITENNLKEDNVKNGVHDDTNSIENVDKEIISDIRNVSDNNNTGSPELVTTIDGENFVNENENTKQGVREKRSVNFQEIIEEENNKLIDSLNNSKNIAINKEPKMSEINKEIETSTNEQLHVAMEPEVIDGIEGENNNKFQNDSKPEQESIESNLSIGSILQHSGELHDTPTYFNEESKLSSDSINENVEKEDGESLLNLEHSGELHDLVIVEKNNNSKTETRQSEESNIESIEHSLQEEEDRLSDKDRKKNKNIIEDSKVENFEENYEIITNDPSGLYDIEELIESEDKISVNLEDGNVVLLSLPESEEKEKRSLEEKDESKILLQPNEENMKSDDIKILTELHELEKSKVPADDLIQSENKTLQLTELPDVSLQGVDAQAIEKHIKDVNLQPFDKENPPRKVDDGTLEINKTAVLELPTADNKLKVDESEEELMENKFTIVNSETNKNSEIKNDISEVTEEEEVKNEAKKFDITKLRAELNEANIVSEEDTDLVAVSENKESSETNKIEEKVDVEGIENNGELKNFDITKLRAELEEAENINMNDTNIGTSTNGKDSVEENKTVIKENDKFEKEITKLSGGLDVEENIIKDISMDKSTVNNGKPEEDIVVIKENDITKENVDIENSENIITEKEKQVSIEKNLETENAIKQFDITKLRAELEEAENVSTKSINLDIPTNKEITNGKEENAKIDESAKKDIKKVDITKLGGGLDVVKEIIKEIKIDSSTEDTESSEINIAEKERNAEIEGNVEISSETKQFDITKLRADLEKAENINTESPNLDVNIVEKIKNDIVENGEIKENTKVEEKIETSEVTKLDAALPATEQIIKEIVLDQSSEKTRSSEETITEKEEISKMEENVESENATNKFDITKLRAELDEAENINTKSPNLNADIVEEIKNDKVENSEIKENTKVEEKIETSEVTKLDAALPVTEQIIKEIVLDQSSEKTGSSEETITEKEEISKMEENVESENATNKFDITKLRAELDEAENINTKSPNLDADIVEEIKNDKEENGEIKESTKVEEIIEKSEVTKLDAALPVTEQIIKKTVLDQSTEKTGSSEETITKKEEMGKIEENVESENATNKFDITKLRAELDEAENINTKSPNLDADIVEEIKNDKVENGEIKESTKVEEKIETSEVTKLHAALPVTEQIIKEIVLDQSTEKTGSSEETITEKEEMGKIEENVEPENATNKFDITKLRAELDEAENINTESTNQDTSTNEKDIVGEIQDNKNENAETVESIEVENEFEKSEVAKLDAGLAVPEEITKDTIIDESIGSTGSSEKNITNAEEVGKIEENKETENAANTFDITKLRTELEEAEKINTKSSNPDSLINKNDIAGEIKDDTKENTKTKESTEVKKEIVKNEVTKDITIDTIIDESIENTRTSEKLITTEEEVAKIEENLEAVNSAKQFDITKLRAELEETENINTKNSNQNLSINENDIVGEIKNNKNRNPETVESTEVEKEVEKTEVTKLDAGLHVTNEITKDTTIDEFKENTGSSEKIITAEEKVSKIEENVEAENGVKKFDVTKLRAELDEAENISTESSNIVEEIKDNKNENPETVKSIEIKKETEKTKVTKLDAELAATEEIIKSSIIDESTEDTESLKKNIIKEEEISKIEENVEIKNFDITKLRAELDEAENINVESAKLDTSLSETNIVGKINDNEKIAKTEKSTDVENEIEQTEVTKTEELIKDTNIDDSTQDIESFEKNMVDKDPSETNQFDITTLRAELDKAQNVNTEITNFDSPTNEKNIIKDIKNNNEENTETEESADIEESETTKLDTDTESSEENIIKKKEDDKNEENIEVPGETKKFDITKLRAELDEAENINTKITNLDTPAEKKDFIEEVQNGKEKNVEIEKSAEVEKEIKKPEVTKLDAGLAVTEESSIDASSEGYGSFEKEEKAKIEENVEAQSGTNTFDITKLRAELDDVQFLNAADKNMLTSAADKDSLEEIKKSTLELNNENINVKPLTVSQLNEDDSNKSDDKVEENTTTTKFDLSKLQAELYNMEESKNDHNVIENMDKTKEVTVTENTQVTNTKIEENQKGNKFDLSKLRAELSKVDDVVKPTDKKELDNNNKSEPEKKIIENESYNTKENTSQLHLIDNENNNDAIKSNTTNDVDHQLTVINNDIQDVNKNIKNENTLQLEPLHTTHSISGKEFEFIPTESSDNLIISPNDSNQSFSNKEVEPKINKEVMTNTNQESNFNQTLLNNETNSINRQDDMIDERAQSGISASPDSEVTVIFNSNSLNKLDDNLVNISGNSTPTDKTELETEESVVNDMGENLENNIKNSDISKSIMETENSSKAIKAQTEDSKNQSNSDLKSTDDKTKDTLYTAATLIQSVYRGHQVRNKLKNQIKRTDESKIEAPYSTDEFNLIQPKKEQELKNEDFGITDALGNLLSQQLAIAAPNAVEVDKSENQPEYIHIPLKGSIDESNSNQNRSVSQLQHSGEFHDIFPMSKVSSDVSKSEKLDEIKSSEDNNMKVEEKPAATNNSKDDDEKYNIVDEENILKLHQAADGSVPQALEVVLNQQLAITTPCAKFEEKDKSKETDKVDYIHIPLKDPNVVTDNTNANFESQHEVEVSANNKTNNGLNKTETVESANINNEEITDNRSNADEEKINKFVNNEKEESANHNVLVNYSFEPDGSIQDENMPMVVQNTQTSGSTVPVEVQPNQAPGAEILTSPTSVDETEASLIIENAEEIAQTSEKDASSKDEPTKNGAHLQTSMETSNRENTTLTEQNMENVAATKIQASFRGYQVRKQLKPKNGGVDSITLRRSLRRKSSGKLRGSENTLKKQMDKSSDLEEKSATKIQAGIRGFLVRRRQTKAKNISQKSS